MSKHRFGFGTVLIAALALIPASSAIAAPTGCDPLDARSCLLPYPSNFNTVAQKGSETGLRLNFKVGQFPTNVHGKSAFPPDLNRNDGFSPGTNILTFVPGLDLTQSGAAPITDIARYADANAPIVVIDATTGKRQPIWAELDTNPDAIAETDGQMLMIHPAKNFTEGHRYIVALRNLKNGAGATIPAAAAFASLRDGKPIASVKGRASSYTSIFATLGKAKISRNSLYLAWDFTVASRRNLSERVLSMRDSSFAAIGDKNLADKKVSGKSPGFTITKVTDFTAGDNPKIAREVEGTIDAPCYIGKGCAAGGTMNYLTPKKGIFSSIPKQQGRMKAYFMCRIPRSALTSPARPSLYGHGLLGTADEIQAGNVSDMASEHNMIFCATPEIGMAEDDVPNAINLLGDMSKFGSMADRMQQGLLNELLLGRAMISPSGFTTNAAFKSAAVTPTSPKPMIDTSQLYYDSNSQGAILGGALTAISPDFTRAVLGVAGMNYSMLLPRSTDFGTYEIIFKPAYTSRLERILLLSVIQNLWDRGETDGYAQHVTNSPLPNTPKHQVLLHVALGDHQVAQVSAENEARTIGAVGRTPVYDTTVYEGSGARTADRTPLWGIPTLSSSNAGGSGIVIWDAGPCRTVNGAATIFATCLASDPFKAAGGSGNPMAPTADLTPTLGVDPHGLPRATPAARQQKSDFLKPNGRIIDSCPASSPCHTSAWGYAGG